MWTSGAHSSDIQNGRDVCAARKERIRMGVAVGVDLGTSNSTIACHGGPGQRFPVSEVPDAVPSVVAYLDGGEVVVGSRARRRGASDPAATIGSAKRFLGRGYPAVAGPIGAVAYDVVPVAQQSVRFDVRGERIAPEAVSACVLRCLVEDLARRLGAPVTEAVLTAPALFGDAQRRALREAAGLAGIGVMRIMNESAAAALAYGFDRGGRQTVMVFDLGGGTLDVGIVDVGFGIVEVRAVAGDGYLGGDDFDRAIADHLADEVADGTGVDPREDPLTWHRLLAAAERAKVRLSSATKTRVSVPVDATGRPGRVGVTLARDAVEHLTADLVRRCRHTTERALTDAGVTPADLDDVIIVGGAARMPAVHTMLGAITRGRPPAAFVDGSGFVARGAAIQAAALRGTVCDALVWDVTPAALRARTPDGRTATIVRRNTATPVTRTVTVAESRPGSDVVVLEEYADGQTRTVGRVSLDQVRNRAGGAAVLAGACSLMFHVDVNGIVSASIQDSETGAERAVPILGDGPRAVPPTVARDAELLVLGRTE
jgi:molecular chaperone DnaK